MRQNTLIKVLTTKITGMGYFRIIKLAVAIAEEISV